MAWAEHKAAAAACRWLNGLISPAGRGGQLRVFYYHRLYSGEKPAGDALPVELFRAQMGMLQRTCTVLPLHEAVARLMDGSIPARAAAISFDDGYTDTFELARPLLLEFGLPATVFVTVAGTESGVVWTDLIAQAVDACDNPQLLLEISGLDADFAALSRPQLTRKLVDQWKYRGGAERQAFAERIHAQFADGPPRRSLMTPEMVQIMAAEGFEIGAHTCTHAILSKLDADEAGREIENSKAWLEQLIGKSVAGFAYPNGLPGTDYTKHNAEQVAKAGFAYAVSTRYGAADRRVSRFEVPRVSLPGGPGDVCRRLVRTGLARRLGVSKQ